MQLFIRRILTLGYQYINLIWWLLLIDFANSHEKLAAPIICIHGLFKRSSHRSDGRYPVVSKVGPVHAKKLIFRRSAVCLCGAERPIDKHYTKHTPPNCAEEKQTQDDQILADAKTAFYRIYSIRTSWQLASRTKRRMFGLVGQQLVCQRP